MLRPQRLPAFVFHILVFLEDQLRKATPSYTLKRMWAGARGRPRPLPHPRPVFPSTRHLGTPSFFHPTNRHVTAVLKLFCFLNRTTTPHNCFPNVTFSGT